MNFEYLNIFWLFHINILKFKGGAIDKLRTAVKPTDGEIIHISSAPSRYDTYAEQNLVAKIYFRQVKYLIDLRKQFGKRLQMMNLRLQAIKLRMCLSK